MCKKKKEKVKKQRSEAEIRQEKEEKDKLKEKNKIEFSTMQIYKYCFQFTKQNWKIILMCQLFSQIPTFTYSYQLQSQKGFENAASQKSESAYISNIFLFIVIEMLQFIMMPLNSKVQNYMKLAISKGMKQKIFNKIIELDHDYHSKYEVWELMNMPSQSETYLLQYISYNSLKQRFESFYRSIIQIQILYNASQRLAIIFFFLLPIEILLENSRLKENKQQNEKNKHRQQKFNNVSLELANGIEAVKIGTAEELIIREYINYKKWMAKFQLKSFIKGTIQSLINILINKIHILVVIYIFYEKAINKEQILSGDITACFGYIYIPYTCYQQIKSVKTIFWPSEEIGEEDQSLIESNKILKLIHYEPKINLNEGKIVKDIKGKIEFKNVTFSYPKSKLQILKDISFTIEPGSYVAFSGKSGTGKSTIMHLIQRFYDPNQGDIYIDGDNLKYLNIFSLRQKLGIVIQKSTLYNMSIKNNILFGSPRSVSDEEVNEICKLTGIDQFTNDKKKFPKGIETKLGWQRKSKREKLIYEMEKKLEEEKKEKLKEEEEKLKDQIKSDNSIQEEEKQPIIKKEEKENTIEFDENDPTLDEPYEPKEDEPQNDYNLSHTNRELSGGQKQLIAIARALIRSPQLLILDEATSNLDSKSEHTVQQCLNQILTEKKNITIIVIAHRLSTIANCQKIFVIEEGNLVEQGSHKELFQKQGAYWNLVKYEIEGTQQLQDNQVNSNKRVLPVFIIQAQKQFKINQQKQLEQQQNDINNQQFQKIDEQKDELSEISKDEEKDVIDLENEDLGDIPNFLFKKAFSVQY